MVASVLSLDQKLRKSNKFREYENIVSILSPIGGSGKTQTALNLAHQFSDKNKVVLLDGNFDYGVVSYMLNLKGQSSVLNYFTGEESIDDVIIKNKKRFDIVTSEFGVSLPIELIKKDVDPQEFQNRLRELVTELSNNYDLVVIDVPTGEYSRIAQFTSFDGLNLYVGTYDLLGRVGITGIVKQEYSRGQTEFNILFNKIHDTEDTNEIMGFLEKLAVFNPDMRFIDVGKIPFEGYINNCINQTEIISEQYPEMEISKSYNQIAKRLMVMYYPQLVKE